MSNFRRLKRNNFLQSQSYQTLISSFFQFLLLSLAILKYRQYFCMLQTLKLNNKKTEKIYVLRRKKFGRIDSSATVCFTDLGKLNFSFKRSSIISSTNFINTSCLKNGAHFKSGENRLENNNIATLIYIRETHCGELNAFFSFEFSFFFFAQTKFFRNSIFCSGQQLELRFKELSKNCSNSCLV